MSVIVSNPHPPGPTCLHFSGDGSKLFTGGNDCLARMWKTDKAGIQEEPQIAYEAEGPITSLASTNSAWLVASLDFHVREYDIDSTVMKALFTRTPGVPVRSVAFDPKGERVAVASDDLVIKIISISDPTQVTLLNGLKSGVRKVTWHPGGNILTSSLTNGSIVAWDTSTSEMVHTIEDVIPVQQDSEQDEFAHDCSAVWHPSGHHFYAASKSHDVISVLKEDWKRDGTLSDPDATGAITALGVSVNGAYLAVATESKQILVYSVSVKKVLFRQSSEGVPVSIAFSPSQNLLAWTALDGTLSRWEEPIPSSFPGPVRRMADRKATAISMQLDNPIEGGDDIGGGMDLDDDNWIIDDLDGAFRDAPSHPAHRGPKEMVSVTKAQPPFQPGATPMQGRKRYLAFNSLGVIEVTDQDIHNVVNVEFHDRSARKGYHFQDTYKYDMASLGERGILYSCPPENSHPARIEYKPYATWASTSEWIFELPPGEQVVALAAGGIPRSRTMREMSDEDIEGNGIVVIGTSRGYLRFFSGGGLQRYIWSIGDDIVSMVAGREWVFLVHREGGTSLDGCQNLKYSLIALDTFHLVQEGRLPLQRSCTLKWIGISDEGMPLMYDSAGVLMMLDRFRQPTQARWIPLLDSNTLARKEGKDESYWPIGLSETKFMCLILKGREEQPGFPRPLVQELDVQMPMLEYNRPESVIEERLLRGSLITGVIRDALGSALSSEDLSRKELQLDKELIQLIQLACKGGQLQRALDSVQLLHHVPSFEGAGKIADFYHLLGLKEKIDLLKEEHNHKDRHQEEKSRRQGWNKHSEPIPPRLSRQHAPVQQPTFPEPTPVRTRNRLKLAAPITQNPDSPFAIDHAHALEDTDHHDYTTSTSRITPEAESIPETVGHGRLEDEHSNERPSAKKRILSSVDADIIPAVPTRSGNPFAKKARLSETSTPSTSTSSCSLLKTNSFFDKVDTMSVDISQKEKKKPKGAQSKVKPKEGPTLTTLFGFTSSRSTPSGGRKEGTSEDVDSTEDAFAEGQTGTQATENTAVEHWSQSQKVVETASA